MIGKIMAATAVSVFTLPAATAAPHQAGVASQTASRGVSSSSQSSAGGVPTDTTWGVFPAKPAYQDCFTYTYRYNIPDGPTGWTMRLDFIDAGKKQIGFDVIGGLLTGSAASRSTTLCNPRAAGKVTVKATMSYLQGTQRVRVTVPAPTFTLRKLLVKTTITASVARPKPGQLVVFTLRSTREGVGGREGNWGGYTVLQIASLSGGSFQTLKDTRWFVPPNGVVKYYYNWPKGVKARFRGVTLKSSYANAAASPAIKVLGR